LLGKAGLWYVSLALSIEELKQLGGTRLLAKPYQSSELKAAARELMPTR
jgi:hypothetical protein